MTKVIEDSFLEVDDGGVSVVRIKDGQLQFHAGGVRFILKAKRGIIFWEPQDMTWEEAKEEIESMVSL